MATKSSARKSSASKATAKSADNGNAPKQTRTRDNSVPEFRVVNASEVPTSRRGRRSKYSQLVTAAKDLKPGQVISISLSR
jgi:hypothetical protein